MAGTIPGFLPRSWPRTVLREPNVVDFNGAECFLRLAGACAEPWNASADSASRAFCDRADCHLHLGPADHSVWAWHSGESLCAHAGGAGHRDSRDDGGVALAADAGRK